MSKMYEINFDGGPSEMTHFGPLTRAMVMWVDFRIVHCRDFYLVYEFWFSKIWWDSMKISTGHELNQLTCEGFLQESKKKNTIYDDDDDDEHRI